ncbi:uncharacterized protein LOC126687772 [Mercurialis annua]|uniref:uncharacterized protein LOC126687772 n=1 Tax=Mercurialis annua TaxID=3986 RepID=UPI002160E6FB|nr:uncharacterized protein LOC126687772 [Mercurialis annua]
MCFGISFWKDTWLGDQSLSLSFPRLFSLTVNKNSLLSDLYDYDNNIFVLGWTRRLRIGDQELSNELQMKLSPCEPSVHQQDAFFWNGKVYTAAAMRYCLQQQRPPRTSSAAFSTFWKMKLPPRILFFLWLLARDRISSNVTLVNRGILDSANAGCTICSKEENSLHIVLHCHFAWLAWNKLFGMCNLHMVMPYTLLEFLFYWDSVAFKRYRVLWRTIGFFCVWELWKARNKRIFDNEHVEVDSLIFKVICKAVQYYKDNNHGFEYSGNDVYRNLAFFCNCD